MLKRIYVEITNICNLSCSFCPGTRRRKLFMSVSDFRTIAEKIRPHTDYIYLHLMGEPLLHPNFKEILDIASGNGFKINITTNGTLINQMGESLLECPNLRKVSFSLHSFEGNQKNLPKTDNALEDYLENIWNFCVRADCILALRLWNGGGAEALNSKIMSFLSEKTGLDVPSLPFDSNGRRLGPRLYLEAADKFDWPVNSKSTNEHIFCHALSEQLGILCDGTVVPCCLDSEGEIALGNIFSTPLDEILNSERAQNMLQGFICRRPSEELCRHCGFATRF